MRRAQRCFFVSPPLRMRWLVAGSVGPGPGVTVLSPRRRFLQSVSIRTWRGLREITYVRVRPWLRCLAGTLDAGTVGRPVDRYRALHYMMC